MLINYLPDLVVDHAAAQLLSGSPDHLGVVAGTGVGSEHLSFSWILSYQEPHPTCRG